MATAIRMPGRPTTMKATRQREVLGQPAAGHRPDHGAERNAEASRPPAPRPASWARNSRVISEWAGGERPASPTPTPKRKAASVAKFAGHAAKRGEARPDDDGAGDDVDPAKPLGEARDGDAQQRVEQGEIEPAQQAQLGVGDLQVDFDRLADGGDDRPVDEVEGVGADQQGQNESLVALRRRPAWQGPSRRGSARRRRAYRSSYGVPNKLLAARDGRQVVILRGG